MIKKIVIDLDDVLANFVEAWNLWIYENGLTSNIITRDEVTSFDYHSSRFGDKVMDFIHLGNCYERIEPLDGALFFLEWCQDNFDDVMILSHASNESCKDHKKEFVKHHFNFDNIQFSDTVNHKYLFTKDCILVDDYPVNLLHHSINNLSPSILFNRDNRNGWSYFQNHRDIIKGMKMEATQQCYFAHSYDDVKHLISLIKDDE